MYGKGIAEANFIALNWKVCKKEEKRKGADAGEQGGEENQEQKKKQ